ncbi:MAG: divergent polysaccharide deacetylase family protein [Campylobacterales bacterium]|nr:divergent polysaccharide deacetylase family protein [Campylobacterales bacterium]
MPKRKRKIPTSKNKSLNQNIKKSSNLLTYLAWALAIVAMILSGMIAGYYFGYEEAKDNTIVEKKDEEKEKRLALLKKLEETKEIKKEPKIDPKQTILEDKKEEIIKKEDDIRDRLKEILKKPSKDYAGAAHEYDGDEVADIKNIDKIIEKKPHITSSKPKLAIIIDDVSIKKHVEAIKSLKIPLTMSFLPPSKYRPNSAKLASKEDFYMVHLPMEAMNFNAEEPITLRITDSQRNITERVDEIVKLFPKVRYINNHTGSLFTSNEIAMNRLVFALKAKNINFVDSRTTAKTKAPEVMKNFGLKYMSRDVFLDHHMEKDYVKGQIKEAIRIAKSHGSAIAIGHPHKNTLQALKESKELFGDVELVYVNNL